MMIIYNVTIKIQPDAAEDWLQWMHREHVPEILATGLFSNARIGRLLEQDESDGVTFSVQYTAANMADYRAYISQHAPVMREKGLKAFGDRFVAFRTVMEVMEP